MVPGPVDQTDEDKADGGHRGGELKRGERRPSAGSMAKPRAALSDKGQAGEKRKPKVGLRPTILPTASTAAFARLTHKRQSAATVAHLVAKCSTAFFSAPAWFRLQGFSPANPARRSRCFGKKVSSPQGSSLFYPSTISCPFHEKAFISYPSQQCS